MKANEIRLGNYYQDRYGNYRIVEELSKSLFVDDHFDRGVSTEQMSPIPLTEEILLKAGWKHYEEEDTDCDSGYMDYYTFDRFIICNWGDGFILSTYMYMHHRIEIKSLHQLQNLFFALTGEEIKIEL